MFIECIDNAGFEDLLTHGMHYAVTDLSRQSVRLLDDSGQLRWFGRNKFAEPQHRQSVHQQVA